MNAWQRSDPPGVRRRCWYWLSTCCLQVQAQRTEITKGAWAAPMPEPVRKTSQGRMNTFYSSIVTPKSTLGRSSFGPCRVGIWAGGFDGQVRDSSTEQWRVLQTHLWSRKRSQEQHIQRQSWLLHEEIHSSMSNFLLNDNNKEALQQYTK